MNANVVASEILGNRLRGLSVQDKLDLDGEYRWYLSGVCDYCGEPVVFMSQPIPCDKRGAGALKCITSLARRAAGTLCNSSCERLS